MLRLSWSMRSLEVSVMLLRAVSDCRVAAEARPARPGAVAVCRGLTAGTEGAGECL